MTGAQAARLAGDRLHLQHGPIDLIIGADGPDGARERAFEAAEDRFGTVLGELVEELDLLRAPARVGGLAPRGQTARIMHASALPHAKEGFVTPMACVAGAVAETVLAAMTQGQVTRAYVNNGGDIALHIGAGQQFTAGIMDPAGQRLGQVHLPHQSPVRGIATSGRHGRSFSMGIADSVTVLAPTASQADVAATLIANAVDLPQHPAITRVAARTLDETSDLGARKVVTHCGPLPQRDISRALTCGLDRARDMQSRGLIHSATLHLQGHTRTLDPIATTKDLAHA